MKLIEIGDPADALARCAADSQAEQVVLTRAGKPAAVVIGVEGYDLEDLQTASDPAFWRMIQDRRRQPTISRDELERRLDG